MPLTPPRPGSLDAAPQMRDHKSFAHHFTIRPNLSVAIGTECYTDDAICESGRRSPFEKDNRGMWSVTDQNPGSALRGPSLLPARSSDMAAPPN